ncbi:hypothetical protein [Saccharopolyspora sp. 5N708]|uniref:hypothetical protein n=1 Tax=Saccharopolyspora sp. 5N708 TaxID=3457424 RepID=UPI003FD4949F
MTTLPWLHVEGARIVDEQGHAVVLQGVGLGGWLNMENFITGYPGPERLRRAALRSALGEQAYQRFFAEFLRGFFAEADAAHLASLGLNSVRIPVNYRHFEDDDRPFQLKESGFAELEQQRTHNGRRPVGTFHRSPSQECRVARVADVRDCAREGRRLCATGRGPGRPQ